MTFQQWLREEGACRDGRTFVGEMTVTEFWKKCDNADWKEWLMIHLGVNIKHNGDGREDCKFCKQMDNSTRLPVSAKRALKKRGVVNI